MPEYKDVDNLEQESKNEKQTHEKNQQIIPVIGTKYISQRFLKSTLWIPKIDEKMWCSLIWFITASFPQWAFSESSIMTQTYKNIDLRLLV